LKSSADLRSNIVVAQKVPEKDLAILLKRDYPIHAELVRKVGYKLGTGYSPLPRRDSVTGIEIRDEQNQIVIDSDFKGIRERFARLSKQTRWQDALNKQPKSFAFFTGGKVQDILAHPELDMKPRRLTINALANKRKLLAEKHLKLKEIAVVVNSFFDLESEEAKKTLWRMIEGMDIRANEGVVIPQFPARNWQIADRKGAVVYRLQKHDIIIGLVRPERRNIGMLMHDGNDIVGSPDGIAVVRVKKEFRDAFPETWLFAELRSESSRLQFWTESGGTSYGKLTLSQIENVIIANPGDKEIQKTHLAVNEWRQSFSSALDLWSAVGSENDRRPIMNSPIIGLEAPDDGANLDE